MKHYLEAWRRYTDFQGRSTRPNFWWPFLLTVPIGLVLGGVSATIWSIDSDKLGPLESIYMLAWLCPGLALGARRLHDTGRSGWWQLLALTGIGNFVLFFWACSPGDTETNTWGPAPHSGTATGTQPGPDDAGPIATGPIIS